MTKRIIWLDIFCRYFICLLMLIYGVVKIFQGQFYTDFYWKDTTLGKLSGMQLTWSFFSYSPVYQILLGFIEVILGLLVFFKRTTRLGVILFLPVIINLVFINLVFNIGALGSAYPLLLAGLILFFINLKSYKAFFFEKRTITNENKVRWLNTVPKVILILVGCLLASIIIYNNKFKIKQDNEIKGAWELEGQGEIKRLYFEKGNVCVIKDKKDSLKYYIYQTTPKRTITISNERNSLLEWNDLPYKIENDTLIIFGPKQKQFLYKIR